MALSLVAAGSPDVLSNAIQFDLPATASYIVGRTNTTWLPLGSASYTPDAGTRLLRFVLSDARGFLDPSSVVLSFRLMNTGTGKLRLRDVPITIFRRVKCFCNGTLVEDIIEAPRLASLMRLCEPNERQENEQLLSNWKRTTHLGALTWASHPNMGVAGTQTCVSSASSESPSTCPSRTCPLHWNSNWRRC